MAVSSSGARTPQASQASVGHLLTVQPLCGFDTDSDVGLTWVSEGSGEVDGVAKDGRDDNVDSVLGEGGIPMAWSAMQQSWVTTSPGAFAGSISMSFWVSWTSRVDPGGDVGCGSSSSSGIGSKTPWVYWNSFDGGKLSSGALST